MAPKKKEVANLDIMSAWTDIMQSSQYQLEDGEGSLYSEEPVDIKTFVSSPDWLGIEPQRHPVTGEKAPAPLSPAQLEFLEKATDFENGVTNLILWVPGPQIQG